MAADVGNEQTHTYMIRPDFKNKFRPVKVNSILKDVLHEELTGKHYDTAEASNWTASISDAIKSKLKDLEFERYKFIVQVVIGEQRGEGVKFAARCLWDSDTDNYSQEIFSNASLFCVAVAYGVFHY